MFDGLTIGVASGAGPVELALPGIHAFRDAGLGVTHVELSGQEPENRPTAFDPARLDVVRGQLTGFGMSGVWHTDSAVNAAEPTPGVREAVAAHLVEHVRTAAALGCPVVVVHGGFHTGADATEHLDALARTLSEVAAVAREHGIALALENMNVLPDVAEFRYLGCTAEEVADVLDAVGSPALGACLDVGHAHLLPGGVRRFLDVLGDRVVHVQLTDNDVVHDDHLALGEGTLDVVADLAAIAASGYRGPVAVELSARQAQRRSLERLRALGWEGGSCGT